MIFTPIFVCSDCRDPGATLLAYALLLSIKFIKIFPTTIMSNKFGLTQSNFNVNRIFGP